MPRYEAHDGVSLFYRDEGEGLPLIALAGLTRNGEDFDFVAPHLSGVRLIRPDYRGRGHSGWADPATYTIAQEAADVLALMDTLGLERAAILGTSRGGLIGMTLAASAPGRLLGLCLNDIGPVIEPRGLAGIASWIGKPPRARTFDEAARARAQLMQGFEGVSHARWLEEVRHLYEETEGGLANRYDPRLAETMQGAPEGPLPDLWSLYDACAGLPMALIRGQNSDLLSTETADEMRKRRPDLHFCDIPGRGHVPFLDEPEALVVINAWLAEMR